VRGESFAGEGESTEEVVVSGETVVWDTIENSVCSGGHVRRGIKTKQDEKKTRQNKTIGKIEDSMTTGPESI
jgi:hypothetical protein